MDRKIHAQGDELSSPIICHMKILVKHSSACLQVKLPVFLEFLYRLGPSWPELSNKERFLFAICFLPLVFQCRELIPDNVHAYLSN